MHIPKKNIEIFEHNELRDTDEIIAFLEHLDRCDFCLDQMLEEESRNPSGPAPSYLSGEILKQAASLDVQASKAMASASRRLQLFCYGLRTAAGVAAALVLLFCANRMEFSIPRVFPSAQTREFTSDSSHGAPNPAAGLQRISRSLGSGISAGSDKLADYLGHFPNNILRGGEKE
ncbi:MAG TPA: hypothetical protein IAA26_13255 [Candidatus Blautia faecipullorum]|nr:hypothetical protein [Candidatus Blautia faecipullorum]